MPLGSQPQRLSCVLKVPVSHGTRDHDWTRAVLELKQGVLDGPYGCMTCVCIRVGIKTQTPVVRGDAPRQFCLQAPGDAPTRDHLLSACSEPARLQAPGSREYLPLESPSL